MYAQRYADGSGIRPVSLGAAIAINGAVVAALLFAVPDLVEVLPRPRLSTFTPAPEPTPPPPDPRPTTEVDRKSARPTPQPTSAPRPDEPVASDTRLGDGPAIGGDGGAGGEAVIARAPPVLPPAFVGAVFDPRFLADIEPPYPDSLRDAGIEGVVRLRIVIGADGRVKHAEPLGGDQMLARIAVRHVLARWRFRPATRGEVPEESTRVMSVRFRLDN